MDANKKWSRRLLIAGVILVVIGAGLMDQAGRTQSAFWWDVSGGVAFAGLVLSALSVVLAEGGQLLGRRRRPGGEAPLARRPPPKTGRRSSPPSGR